MDVTAKQKVCGSIPLLGDNILSHLRRKKQVPDTFLERQGQRIMVWVFLPHIDVVAKKCEDRNTSHYYGMQKRYDTYAVTHTP